MINLVSSLTNSEMVFANKTLEFVKKRLSGIEFAVTGSYANTLLNDSDTFNKNSDLDIAVYEKDIKKITNLLFNPSIYKKIKKTQDYGFPPPPSFLEIEKVQDYGGSGGGGPFYLEFSENLLKGTFTPTHIIGSLTNKQKSKFTEINGIKYLEPVAPKYLSLAA